MDGPEGIAIELYINRSRNLGLGPHMPRTGGQCIVNNFEDVSSFVKGNVYARMCAARKNEISLRYPGACTDVCRFSFTSSRNLLRLVRFSKHKQQQIEE